MFWFINKKFLTNIDLSATNTLFSESDSDHLDLQTMLGRQSWSAGSAMEKINDVNLHLSCRENVGLASLK